MASLQQEACKFGLIKMACSYQFLFLNASHWTHQDAIYPAVTLTPADIANMYSELGFSVTCCDVIDGLEGKIGYSGFIMACGKRQ